MFANVWNSVTDKIIDVKDSVVDSVEEVSDFISEGSAKVWNATTGKATFLEAEKLYEEIERRYTKAFAEYEKNISHIAIEIEKKVSNINFYKEDIHLNHFKRFKELGNKLHNISINGKHFLEYFDDSITKINKDIGLRNKEEIFKIDFNNLKFPEIALGILTLGFSTRKKAKESLTGVKAEKTRINSDIEKMNTQVVDAKIILKSIDSVSLFFTEQIKVYSKLLDRFEYAIKSQIQKNILKGNQLKNGKLDFKMIPIAHIQDFQALFNLSIVLHQMSRLGYLSENGKLKDEDIKSLEKVKDLIKNNTLFAA